MLLCLIPILWNRSSVLKRKKRRKERKRKKIAEKKMFISSILIITTILLQGHQRQGIIVHAAKITLTQEIQITTTIHVSPTTTSTWTLLLEEGSTLLPPLTALEPVSGPGTLATTTGISILGTYDDDDDDDDVVSPSHHYYYQTPTQTSTLTRDSASYQPSSFSSSSSTTNTPASKVLLIGSDNGSHSALPLTAGGSAQTISGTRYSLDECRLFVDTTKTAMLGYSGRECEPTTTATATSVIRKIWTSTRTVPVEVTSKVIMIPAAAAAAAASSSRLHAGVNSTRVGMGRNYTLTTTTTSSAATTATKGIVLLGAPLAGQRNSTMTRSRAPWTSTTSSSSGITASGSATATSQSDASLGCKVDRRVLVWWLMMAGVLLFLVG